MDHCQFKDFISNAGSEHRVFCAIQKFIGWVMVRRLNVWRQWKWRWNLFISSVMHDYWCVNVAFYTDITQLMNELNTNLQRVDHLVNEMPGNLPQYERKLQLRELQMPSNNMTHFQILRTKMPTDAKKCNSTPVSQDMWKHEATAVWC